MPPDTLWNGNTNPGTSVKFDDATTLFDAAIPFDGMTTQQLIPFYTPNDTAYTNADQPNNTQWSIPNPL